MTHIIKIHIKKMAAWATGLSMLVLMTTMITYLAVCAGHIVVDAVFIITKTGSIYGRLTPIGLGSLVLILLGGGEYVLARLLISGITIVRIAGSVLESGDDIGKITKDNRVQFTFASWKTHPKAGCITIRVTGRRFYDPLPFWLFDKNEYAHFVNNYGGAATK